MISVALVRHAKSDWGDPSLPDHDRPLNARGERDAPVQAARLADTGFRPDVILSSTALRARTTARAFADEFGVEPDLQSELYAASAPELLRAVEEAGLAGADSVLIVAHDPGMTDLACALSGERIDHMPTCAVATFSWDDDDWHVIDSVEPAQWDLQVP
ncbi:MAG TPA: histidine phosphatase family protein [Microbacterium sp.]|jgi:phosphohistidine phosphatase|uniref:SixA phosphatase family protein n=1 Tax=Microbacterium sp. TaxID=51671 RepID=UPI002B4839EE|nr:histidine phosphatase family protein [Microbacterium sp.]HKT57305.1 histidine phosphatase family protein [Microbacterium sp.]